MEKVRVVRRGRVWQITIDGKHVSVAKLAKMLKMDADYIRRSLSSTLPNHRAKFIQTLLWKKRNGVPTRSKIYKNPKGELMAVACIHNVWPTIAHSTVNRRMKGWVSGEYDIDEIYEPPRHNVNIKIKQGFGYGSERWGGLSNKPRDENLRKIPEPTKYDRRLCGSKIHKYSGRYPVDTNRVTAQI